MREPTQLAVRLTRLWESVEELWPTAAVHLGQLDPEFAHRLHVFVRLMLENDIIFRAARSTASPPPPQIAEDVAFLAALRPTVQETADILSDFLGRLGERFGDLLAWADDWRRVPRPLNDMDELRWLGLQIREVLEHTKPGRRPNVGGNQPTAALEQHVSLDRQQKRLVLAQEQWKAPLALAASPSVDPLAHVQQVCDALRGHAEEYPLPDGHPLSPVTYALRHSLRRLVRETCALLDAQALPAVAISRMVAYFEHFDRGSLLQDAAEAPRPEDVVQRAVDRFLFTEGLFPITHCGASGGSVDTLADLEPLADAAERRRIPAVLVELKQLLREGAATPKDIVKKAEEARDQVETYAQTLRALRSDAVLQQWAIVFYGGPKRYRREPRWDDEAARGRAHIELVYVGDARPSEGVHPLT